MFTRPDKITDKLYVITPVFNPERFRSRWKHYENFAKHILNSGAHLITIECAFGAREHALEVTNHPNHTVIHVRTKHEIWIKENLINVAVRYLPSDWKYVATIDADMIFTRPDWVGECLQQLQHFPIIQMFTKVDYLNQYFEITNSMRGFMKGWRDGIPFRNSKGVAVDDSFFKKNGEYEYCQSKKIGWAGAPGGAWAYTREAWDAIGGLYEMAILGSGDYHMATALMGFADISLNDGYSTEFKKSVLDWQTKALRHIKKNVGYMDGTLLHFFHGNMVDRNYGARWKILVKHKYTPHEDVKKDAYGVLQLEDEKWQLRDDIRNYFRSRNEDAMQ